MAAGISAEPLIRDAYAEVTGEKVISGEFFVPRTGHNVVDDALVASSDGRVGWRRLVEIKYPQQEYTRHANGIPLSYIYQIQGQMAISGIGECDFVVVCAASQRARVVRVFFSPELWEWMWPKLVAFYQWCHLRHFGPGDKSFRWDAAPLHKIQVQHGVIDEAALWACFQRNMEFAAIDSAIMTSDQSSQHT
eukprot:TRINITY_DN4992_c0_g1_i1.p2 TRINITY_DN4992_c0_g1~~TRINITY_DN4992_c0_g1_i1.p2  ORF type:complete len:192 (-),score=38.01 TRINITY_DN4992_c0_g1_i1:728-1303(-)